RRQGARLASGHDKNCRRHDGAALPDGHLPGKRRHGKRDSALSVYTLAGEVSQRAIDNRHLQIQLLLPRTFSSFFIAASTAFFMLRVSAPWLGGNSCRLFRCAVRKGPAAVG